MKNRLNIAFFITLFCAQASALAETDVVCHSPLCIDVSVVSPQGEGLADLVVYLEPLSGQVLAKSTQTITIAQKDQTFSPYITVSQTGQQVKFVNQDEITHHIYSAGGSNNFAFKIQAGEEHLAQSFEHQTEVAMGCNIHDWMSGYLLVVDTPYFAKTDKQGVANFAIEQGGRYRVVVWHPQLAVANNRLSKEYELTQGASYQFVVTQDLQSTPTQSNSDDFDFLSGY